MLQSVVELVCCVVVVVVFSGGKGEDRLDRVVVYEQIDLNVKVL